MSKLHFILMILIVVLLLLITGFISVNLTEKYYYRAGYNVGYSDALKLIPADKAVYIECKDGQCRIIGCPDPGVKK